MKIQAVKFRKDGFYYICSICGYVFEPAEHDGVAFEDICPRTGNVRAANNPKTSSTKRKSTGRKSTRHK